MKSILEENLETIKLKTQLARNEIEDSDRQFIEINDDTPLN